MKREAAEKMRLYIVDHLDDDITPADVASAVGYSERHGNRVFVYVMGKSLGEYIRLLRLSAAADELSVGQGNVLDVALSHGYDSHEGFTKAFSSAFGINPKEYRKGGHPINYFMSYPVFAEQAAVDNEKDSKGEVQMSEIVTATIIQRPKRKMIIMYSKSGTDYFSFCEEKGCDWEGIFHSIPERLDMPAYLTLPPGMRPEGCAEGAVGVEVPASYNGEVPAGYELIDLESCEYVFFQSMPFENENDFPKAIGKVFEARDAYQPKLYGYSFDKEKQPELNFGAEAKTGARIAVPVKRI